VKKEQPENYYEFKEVIGEGSYGQVFRAVCKKTG
jgi:serine/threonine protein kinase